MNDVRLIDANALMKRIEEAYCKDCNSYNGIMCRACAHMDDMDFIEDAPTIDAQPVKHGTWERTDMFVKCSECGVELLDEAFFGIRVFDNGYMPFCPCCCAKMNGVDAE